MHKHHEKLDISTSRIICPKCLEILVREDIEGFGHCPYCDYAFDLDTEMEDFLLSPVVRQWASQQRPSPMDDMAMM